MGSVTLKCFTLLLFLNLGCATSTAHKSTSYHLPGNNQSYLGKKINQFRKEHPGKNGFVPLLSGEDAFKARIVATKKAEQSLDMQYYIWHDDLTGLAFIRHVKEAAKRGVRVRLLLDNLNEAKYQTGFKILALDPNIEIRLINPNLKFINHRMHNKSFIADNQLAIVGGRNIGDEYFDASESVNFSDFDVMMIGPAVDAVSKEFDLYWNSERSFSIEDVSAHHISERDIEKTNEKLRDNIKESLKSSYIEELRSTELDLKPFWGNATVLYDPPEKLKGDDKRNLSMDLHANVKHIKRELILISPYFIPGKNGMKTLKDLRSKGIRIVVLTNSLASNDVGSVYEGYKKYKKDLLRNGIELYELRPKEALLKHHKGHFGSSGSTGLHGKVMILDRKRMFVGSMNLDARSKDLNTEMGVLIDNEALATNSAEDLLKALPEIAYKMQLIDKEVEWIENKNGVIKSYDKEPETTWWERTKTWFSSLFVPEELL